MTLGKKLSNCRKLAGLTQQQLGEKLNLSAQAISKWENDMAEPDLASLKVLADLYKVTVDDLLDPKVDLHSPQQHEAPSAADGVKTESFAPIGYCKVCGIAVTEKNKGSSTPVVLCKACLAKKNEEERLMREKEARAKEETRRKGERRKAAVKSKQKTLLAWSISLASIAFVLSLVIGIFLFVSAGAIGIFIAIAFALCLGCFVGSMFFECAVKDVFWDWASKSFHAPGLIFSFDLDGFLWLIGMKILFWAIGILFGLFVGAIGFAIALLIAPFVYPYVIVKVAGAVKGGVESDFVEFLD